LKNKMLSTLKIKFPQAIIEATQNLGDDCVVVKRENILTILQFLKLNEECPFDMLLDVCGVDYPSRDPRFEVVYHLYSLPKKARLRVKVGIPENDLKVPSVYGIWKAADWFEREAYDMFGITFEGHPNLKRLLMWEGFQGHPLRKDYPIDKRQPIPESLDIV
jgi:NADH-quinone oxidoreductase subunit C